MDDIDLDHINADPEYNLQSLCENDNPDGDTSPYELSNTSCKYYEPCNVKSALSGNDLSMFGLNCQGLRAHWDSFYNLICDMSGNSHHFDIIAITELYGMTKGDCIIPGYHPLEFKVRNDSNNSRGGIGIYIKNVHKYKVRNDLSIFIPNIFESMFIEITFGKKQTIIGNIYPGRGT